MSAKRKVWAKHLPTSIAAAVGLGLAGPLALVAVPFIGLWWRKAAKDAVSADLEDEMKADRVESQLERHNEAVLDEWRSSDRNETHCTVRSAETR